MARMHDENTVFISLQFVEIQIYFFRYSKRYNNLGISWQEGKPSTFSDIRTVPGRTSTFAYG
jgi:hypothetical protein